MKRLVLLTTLGLALCVAGSFVGCSDDDNDVVGPTAADSAKVELFMSQYGDIDEVNGQMLNFTLHVIDSLMEAAPGKVSGVIGTTGAEDVHVTLDWHSASEYWYCTAVDTVDDGATIFNYVDSIQIMHGEAPVQWPVDSLITEIRTYMRLHVAGEGIDTATAWQNGILSVDSPLSDTLHVDGTGGLYAELSEEFVDYGDTTNCDLMYDLAYTYTDLQFDSMSEGPEVGCPIDGALGATGTVEISCTGAEEGSVSGTWTVTEEFDDGTINFTIQHGGFTFKGSDSCD